MITYQKAKQQLDPGDQVFVIINGQVETQTITRIHMDSISVQDGYLYFDDHGQTWWLTRLVAQQNCVGGKYGKINNEKFGRKGFCER